MGQFVCLRPPLEGEDQGQQRAENQFPLEVDGKKGVLVARKKGRLTGSVDGPQLNAGIFNETGEGGVNTQPF